MTDAELGLLEHITYVDKNVLEIAKTGATVLKMEDTWTVGQVLDCFDEDAIKNLRDYGDKTIDGAMMSGNEWADVIENIQNNSKLNSLKVVKAETYTNTLGDSYNLNVCYEVPGTKQCIVTYKGTTGYFEWNDNVHGILESCTTSQWNALYFFNKYTQKYKDVIVVGHSKGANKAMFVTVADITGKVSRCVAFDGQGFSNKFLKYYASEISKKAGIIKNYYISTDFVHVLMKQIPGIHEISCKGYGMTNGAQFHSPNSFFKVDENGKIILDKHGSPIFVEEKEDNNIKLIRSFVSYVMDNCNDDELLEIADCLGPIAGASLGEKDLLKVIVHITKNLKTLVKIRLLISEFAAQNNLGVLDFMKLLMTFCVNAVSCITLSFLCYIIMKISPAVKIKVAYEFIKMLLDEARILIEIADELLKELCLFLEERVQGLLASIESYWDSVVDKVDSFVSGLTGDAVRNYTEEFKEELIDLYNEIHSENLFDVMGFVYFGGWNTGFVDHIDVDENVGNIKRIYNRIDEYDEKVIYTIREMFDRANQVDTEYAKLINNQTKQLESLTSAFKVEFV